MTKQNLRSQTREEARKKAKAQAERLVSQMTLEERASQLRYDAPAIERLGVPAYNWWNEALHGVARAGVATVFPQAIGMAATFDAPLLKEIGDAIAVEGRAKYNASAAHGDRDIYKGLTFWAPNVNIFRDPRWGRGHETYGEDPYLTARLGVAFVEGMQGDGEVMKAAACAKHFAVHSGPEALRHEFDAVVSDKDLNETYLPAFKALVTEAGVEAVMGAYNRTNGEPCCGSKMLLVDTLRGKWGFAGHVVSDCWAILDFHRHHKVTRTAEESAALALRNGCDVNCGNTYLHLMKAYQEGLVTEEQITTAAVRLFTTRFLLGILGEGSEYDRIPYSEVESGAHLALSQRAAEESIVLLKNDGLLPLDLSKLKTIGVIGPNADSRAALIGNYHGTSSQYVTVLEGIRELVGERARIYYSQGSMLADGKEENLAAQDDRLSEAQTVAENSDVVILCVGLDERLEGEEMDQGNQYGSGDKNDLLLPASQRRLLEAVAVTGKPVVLCLMAGSDIDLSYAQEHFGAIVDLWYPGALGGRAAARVLFGEVSPSGKLPVTFYEDLEGMPAFTDYAMEGRTYRYLRHPAQYPFGFGLTYGDIMVTGAEIEKATDIKTETGAEIKKPADGKTETANGMQTVSTAGHSDGTRMSAEDSAAVQTEKQPAEAAPALFVHVTVENRGARAAQDVVQVYLRQENAPDNTANWSLCAFARTRTLEAGQKQELTLPVRRDALCTVDEKGELRREATDFTLFVGTSQPDARSAALTGHEPVACRVSVRE